MGHYAKVVNGMVTQVIVAEPEFIDSFEDTSPGEWIKASYNIRGGIYYESGGDIPAKDQSVIEEDEGRKRKNYPGVGFSYDEKLNAFIPPKPYDSWLLDETTCFWEPPVERPSDVENYVWDEETISWIINDTENM